MLHYSPMLVSDKKKLHLWIHKLNSESATGYRFRSTQTSNCTHALCCIVSMFQGKVNISSLELVSKCGQDEATNVMAGSDLGHKQLADKDSDTKLALTMHL